MKCPKCGYAKNVEGNRLCNLCGEVLGTPAAATPATIFPPSPGPTEIADPPPSMEDTGGASPVPPAAGGSPAEDRSAPEGGFCHLRCSLLERPLRLRSDRPITMGRGGDNDIVIPSQMVSRHHGKVAYEGGVWVYSDLKSSNGSRVNGKRTDRVVLQSGDTIDLGGFLITYKEIHDLSDVSDQGTSHDQSKTVAIDANMLKRAAMSGMDGVALLGGLGGSLADIAIPDILQLMEMQRKSGTLTLDFEGAMGKIYLMGGNMVHAEYGKITGETAIYKMLKKTKGSFHFDPREPRVEPTIQRPTTSVLLDASREMDEGGR